MTISEFISYLDNLDIKLSHDGDQLRLNAPKGALTPELRAELSERKAEIIAFLRVAGSKSRQPAPRIKPVPRNGKLPLSFAQQRLWFLDQLEPHNVAYNMPVFLRLRGALDIVALERSLSEIVRRHEGLRTVFVVEEDQPHQCILPIEPYVLPVVDLRQLPQAEREAEAERLMLEEMQAPFDLAQGPLFRAKLLQLAEDAYFLLLNMHHIVSDGWSIDVLFQELQVLYQSFLQGKAPSLPDLSIQYADFAYWQREWLQGDVLENQLDYWRRQLNGELPVMELPTDRPRPKMQTFHGAVEQFSLPLAKLDELKALGQATGSSLFMTVLAAFKVLLYRYTGQPDVIVGSPIANRNQYQTEQLIGFFVNNLVLRTDLSGNPSFRDLIGRVREVALGAYSNQDIPFDVLVEALDVTRDTSRSPLFQVMFILQNAANQKVTLPGLTLEPLEDVGGTAKFDLTLETWEQPEPMGDEPAGLYFSFEYNSDLFEATTIRRMMGHLQTLLEAVTADPDWLILDVPLLTPAEREQMLVMWNNTAVTYPQQPIYHLIAAQAEQTPEATAVIFEGQSLTYRQLNERANRLAHYLQKLGVGPEALVGIYVERSLEMMVGLLGILKAGGAYLPLDPAFPEDRLAFMLEDGQAQVLLTQHSLANNLALPAGTIAVCLDSDWDEIAQEPATNPTSQATMENLAYILYTSGSTGKPKGVQISHRAFVNFLVSMQQEPGLSAGDRLLAVTTLSFDIAGLELFLPLLAGAATVIVSQATAVDGYQLMAELTKHDITLMQATPATWRMLMEMGWQGKSDLKILCGGEAMPRDLAAYLLPRCHELWNMYGPTETTVWSTVEKITSAGDLITIGRPINNTLVYILDKGLQPAPVGVAGELHIGGDGVARGYLNRPELTAERFIDNPFIPDTLIYKTGDLARWLPDGRIECLGRIDHQVKIRGFRIELGEIESVLSQHTAVQEVVVIVREDQPGDKRLVAYLVAEQEQDKAANDDLRHFVRQQLPDYMVPSAYVWLDALPLTPNRKVDRKALPAPDVREIGHAGAFVEPASPMEITIAGIWQELLKVDQISIRDNFFDLGGHSLLSVQFVTRLEKAVGVRINPGELIFQTLEQLAVVCEEQLRSGPDQASEKPSLSRRLLNPLKQAVSYISGN